MADPASSHTHGRWCLRLNILFGDWKPPWQFANTCVLMGCLFIMLIYRGINITYLQPHRQKTRRGKNGFSGRFWRFTFFIITTRLSISGVEHLLGFFVVLLTIISAWMLWFSTSPSPPSHIHHSHKSAAAKFQKMIECRTFIWLFAERFGTLPRLFPA